MEADMERAVQVITDLRAELEAERADHLHTKSALADAWVEADRLSGDIAEAHDTFSDAGGRSDREGAKLLDFLLASITHKPACSKPEDAP